MMKARGNIYILTGPIQSGKSEILQYWVRSKNAGGFVTPTVSGLKTLYLVESGVQCPYQVEVENENTIKVGNFILDKNAFSHAKDSIAKALASQCVWIVIDEIGKLELKNQGHHELLEKVLKSTGKNLLIVVRDTLVQAVISKYALDGAAVITTKNLQDNF